MGYFAIADYLEFRMIASPEFSCRLGQYEETKSRKPTPEVAVVLTNDQVAILDQTSINIRHRPAERSTGQR